ncbi:hypothetical protein HHI36_005456 [Cryptolaemus montrouzieri]|uniref:TGF-beta propeptide domain-containing protein n=1 Tax=Cryptolaemus montrouzieri TaxID=559131 RepID=A0ABD2NUE3_9CUCU
MKKAVISIILFHLSVNVLLNVKLTYCLRPSGFYSDNEFDQTEIDWSMTKQEKREMEMELLNLLGLPYRPQKINESHIRKAAPRFMLDVYKSLMEEENDENYRSKRSIGNLDLNLSEKNAIDESDVIMTIESVEVAEKLITKRNIHHINNNLGKPNVSQYKAKTNEKEIHGIINNLKANASPGIDGIKPKLIEDMTNEITPVLVEIINTHISSDHHLNEVRHERGKRLWFNVSDVPIAENIVGAELRLYKHENHRRKKSKGQYTITVYQLINIEDGERELEYVSAVNTSASSTGWLDLNLTQCLANWVAFPDSNKGLYLSVHQVDKPGHEIRPEDIGLVTARSEDETHPFMVAFLKATNHVKARRSTREVRRRVKKSDYASVMKNTAQDVSPHETPRSCKIRTLYISFKDINWKA